MKTCFGYADTFCNAVNGRIYRALAGFHQYLCRLRQGGFYGEALLPERVSLLPRILRKADAWICTGCGFCAIAAHSAC